MTSGTSRKQSDIVTATDHHSAAHGDKDIGSLQL